ncbi:hypothetical protein VPHD148_0193 [Vibrio phage D148]
MHYYEHLLDLPVHLLVESYPYIKCSDSAHNEEHIRAVVREANTLYKGWCPFTRRQIIAAALMHDLGCSVRGGRDRHEIYSAQIARGLMHGYYGLNVEEILTAILQHRASYTGKRDRLVANIVAAADRGRPNAAVLFMRAYVYTKEVNDVDHDTAIRHAIDYNIAKYGYEGYSRMQDDKMLMKYYPEESVAIERIFEEATVDYVESCLERFSLC